MLQSPLTNVAAANFAAGKAAGQAQGTAQGAATALKASSGPVFVRDTAETLSRLGTALEQRGQDLTPQWLNAQLRGINIADALLIAASILLTVLLLRLAGLLAKLVLAPLARRTPKASDDELYALGHRLLRGLALFGGWFLIIAFLNLPSSPIDWRSGAWRVYMTCILVWAGLLLYRLLFVFLGAVGTRQRAGHSLLDRSMVALLQNVLRFLVFALVAISIIQGWGYNAGTLLAGIGLGGLAVAFAAQDTIANFFGSLILYTDRPYKLGDWIQIGDVDGYVEHISLRSTRVRQFDGNLVIMPNKVVTSEEITNLGQASGRKLMFRASFSTDQPVERLRAAVVDVRALMDSMDEQLTPKRYAHIEDLADTSGTIQVIAYSRTLVVREWFTVRQELILGVLEILARHGVKTGISEFTALYGSDAPPTQAPQPPE